MCDLENVSQSAPKDIFEVVTGTRCDRKRKSVSMHQVIQCVTLKVKAKMDDVSCIATFSLMYP